MIRREAGGSHKRFNKSICRLIWFPSGHVSRKVVDSHGGETVA